MIELANAGNVKTPLLDALLAVYHELLGTHFPTSMRTLQQLGMEDLSIEKMIKRITDG
jgi:hypothetical protein